MYKYIALFSTFFLALTFVLPVLAETFTLTHIGGMATKGVKYNQWWYEPQRVVLKGTAAKESNIALIFDNKTETIKVNSEGNWSFDMGTLDIADHTIVLNSGLDRYAFVLTIGSPPPADMSGTKGGLPAAGAILPFLGLVGVAALLIIYSLRGERA